MNTSLDNNFNQGNIQEKRINGNLNEGNLPSHQEFTCAHGCNQFFKSNRQKLLHHDKLDFICHEEKSNLIKFNNSPKFKFGNGNRSENKNTNLSLGDRYLIYSSFGEQIMTQKDSRPQFTFGKENRFGK